MLVGLTAFKQHIHASWHSNEEGRGSASGSPSSRHTTVTAPLTAHATCGCLSPCPPHPPPPADEKYNFERLQRTTTLNRQPLLAPQALELSPTEELTVRWGAWQGVEVGWSAAGLPAGLLQHCKTSDCPAVLSSSTASQWAFTGTHRTPLKAVSPFASYCLCPSKRCSSNCPAPCCLFCRDNLEVFTRNGFDFCDDTATGRLRLSAVPFR